MSAHCHALEAGHGDKAHGRLGVGAETGDKLDGACGVEALGCDFGSGRRKKFVAEVDFHNFGGEILVEGNYESGAAGLAAVDVYVHAIVISGLGIYCGHLEVGGFAGRGCGGYIEGHITGSHIYRASLIGRHGNGVGGGDILGAVGLHIVNESL